MEAGSGAYSRCRTAINCTYASYAEAEAHKVIAWPYHAWSPNSCCAFYKVESGSSSHPRCRAVGAGINGQIKVTQLNSVVRSQQHVLRLDVAVYQLPCMHLLERHHQWFKHKLDGLCWRQGAATGGLEHREISLLGCCCDDEYSGSILHTCEVGGGDIVRYSLWYA